jgi:hypothetical protein
MCIQHGFGNRRAHGTAAFGLVRTIAVSALFSQLRDFLKYARNGRSICPRLQLAW